MNFATRIVFFTILTAAASKPENKTCPSYDGSHYLSVPEEIIEHKHSVCGKLFSTSACCSEATIKQIEYKESPIFKVHKVIVGPTSKRCETALMQYACLYECSPELGRLKNLTNPLKDVPICMSSCAWLYSSCSFDVICTEDWGKVFYDADFKCNITNKSMNDFMTNKFETAEEFCSMMRETGIAKMTTNDEECFSLKTGRFVERKPQTDSMAYNIFAYMGLTVIGILICLAIFYAGNYVMRTHRIVRSI